jgi:hypothetical protein
VIDVKDAVGIVEGAPAPHRIGTDTPGSAETSAPDPAPHRVYSLDGLLALALAVQELEVGA